ncbi:hypothetical protein HAX54_050640, partial [Datura stramonium]|nr:hypothetical protein [Datura stramonium]
PVYHRARCYLSSFRPRVIDVFSLIRLTPSPSLLSVVGSSHQLSRLNTLSNFSLLKHVYNREFLVHGRELGGLVLSNTSTLAIIALNISSMPGDGGGGGGIVVSV